MMNNFLNNVWVVTIIGGIISILIYEGIRRIWLRGYNQGTLIFSVTTSTLVFAFGNLIEPSVRSILEGDSTFWQKATLIRKYIPWTFLFVFFLSGLLPGIVTGLMVARGDSLAKRMKYALVWSPTSLLFFDFISYATTEQSLIWNQLYFSLISDVVGGIVGALIIGSAVHLFVARRFD